MTKAEVIDYLGKSKRTVETFVARGRLGVSYVAGPNGKTARFRRSEVEALKRDIETPTHRAVPLAPAAITLDPRREPLPESGLAWKAPSGDPLALLTAAFARLVPAQPAVVRPWLSLAEAVDYSGLPARYLVQGAISGTIRAVNVGSGDRAFWRFSRDGLTR